MLWHPRGYHFVLCIHLIVNTFAARAACSGTHHVEWNLQLRNDGM